MEWGRRGAGAAIDRDPSCPFRGTDGFLYDSPDRTRYGRAGIATAVVFLCAVSGCDRPAADRAASSVPDARSPTAAPPARIVSLVPSVTDLLLELGAGERLIARTAFDQHPSLDSLPSVGPGLTPNTEWILARSPDLAIAWPDAQDRQVVQRLRTLGVPVYQTRLESVHAVLRTTRALGRILGLEARADSLADSMGARLDSVRSSRAGAAAPSVLYVAGGGAPYAPAAGTYIHELITIAGGRNVLRDLGPGWVQLSLEEIVRRQPDVIVGPSGGADLRQRMRDAPGWRDLEAVRAGRVELLDPALFERPGPRLPEAAARLADAIHGAGDR